MNRPPSFQYYPGDWLGSQRVQMLTLEEEGAYIRLIGYCWKQGSIPADPVELARLIGKGASSTLATTVATMFQPCASDETRLVHDRLDAEREKQVAWREKSAKGGKNSAKSRIFGKGGSRGASRVVEGCFTNGDKGALSLPISTSVEVEKGEEGKKSKAKASSVEEAEEYAISIKCQPGQGTTFFDKMEGCGWTNAGKPVKDWKATMRAWNAQGYMPVPVNYRPPESVPDEPFQMPDPTKLPGYSRIQAMMDGLPLPGDDDAIEYLDPNCRD